MSENSETNAPAPSLPSLEETTGQIFADEPGKEVFSAFEKLGSELNKLTDNLEQQFEDGDEEEPLGSFDFKGFVAKTIKGISSVITGGSGNSNKDESPMDAEEDDIIALLNAGQEGAEEEHDADLIGEQQSEGSPTRKGHVKRDSTGASSIDADSIASGGSHLPKKISALINSMRIRSLSLDESSLGGGASVTAPVADEWENDDDCGYTVITLSEEEFFDYEEVQISDSKNVGIHLSCSFLARNFLGNEL
jgi:hypothetical protein